MKILYAMVATVALAACSQAEAPEEEAATEEVVAEVPMAVDGGTLAGTYNTVDGDGGNAVWTLADDGTFTLAAEGADPVAGTYTNTPNEDGSATFCADPDGDEAGETCFAISNPNSDGGWTATDPDGNVLTVSRGE